MNEPQSIRVWKLVLQDLEPLSNFWVFTLKRLAALNEALFINPQSVWVNAFLGVLLVSVPVFFEAPLVRLLPWVSVLLSGVWFWLSDRLAKQPSTQFIGDLLWGFSWSWLAGAIYWGWFRWEPLWHLPIESIGLPVAIWGLLYGRSKVGHIFYIGSLLGTAVTDIYFYWMDLMPYWRQLMLAEPAQTFDIVRVAFAHVQTPAGVIAAATCALGLLTLAGISWRSAQRHDWIFSGTLLGTLLVDSLFVCLAWF